MKTSMFNNQKVQVIKILNLKLNMPKGIEHRPIIDNEGSWVQVEFLDGKNKGNRIPVTLESLK